MFMGVTGNLCWPGCWLVTLSSLWISPEKHWQNLLAVEMATLLRIHQQEPESVTLGITPPFQECGAHACCGPLYCVAVLHGRFGNTQTYVDLIAFCTEAPTPPHLRAAEELK